LHRCFREDVDGILQRGLKAIDLQGTATWQPRDAAGAEGLYRAGRDYGNCAVVVRIPRDLWERLHSDSEYRGAEVMHPEIGNLSDGEFRVLPKFIPAWIDRDNDEITLNSSVALNL